MNAGDPIRFGFKLCARCETWVLKVAPWVEHGEPIVDIEGKPQMACVEKEYCKHAGYGAWCPVWGANRCAHRGECVGSQCISADRFEGKLLNKEER